MPMLRPVINDLSAGELSPLLYGRVDLPGYYKGAKEITNFQVRPMGGVRKRAGTSYMCNTYNNSKTRLIPFVVGSDSAFILDISATSTPGSARLRILTPSGVALTSANLPLTVPYLLSELFEVKYAQTMNEITLVHKNHPPVWLRFVSESGGAVTIDYTVSDQSFAGNILNWKAPVVVPYDAYDLWEFTAQWMIPNKTYPCSGTFGGIATQFAKRTDLTLYLSTTNTFPVGANTIVISRSSQYSHAGEINIDVRPFIGAGNYPGAVAYFAGRLWLGGSINDPAALWASKPWDYKSFILCETIEYDISEKIDSQVSNHTGITTYVEGVGSKTVTSVTPAIPADAVGKYVTGQYIPYGAKVVTRSSSTQFIMDMPSLGKGTCEIAFSVWKDSNVPEYDDKKKETQQIGAANAIQLRLSTEENESILWISGSQDIFIGTSSSEWIVPGATTAVQAKAILSSRYGSANIQSRFVGDALMYVTPSSRHVRQLGNGISPPLTMQAEHIVKPGIVQLDFAQSPDVNLYAVLANGELVRCLIEPGASVMSWDRIKVRDGDSVESVAILPGTDRDVVYIVVKRTINGSVVRFIEKINENEDDTVPHQIYLDASKTASGTDIESVEGLEYLNGETVTIRHIPSAGGSPLVMTAIPAAGSVTIPKSSWAIVGIPYKAKLRLNRIDSPETEGLTKGIGRIFFRLFRSSGFVLKSTDTGVSTPVMMPSDTYTGPLAVTTDIPSQTDAEIIIESNDPSPCGIQTIVPDAEIGG